MSKVLGSSAPAITAERATLFWMGPREIAPFQPENFPVYLWDSSDGTIFYGFPHADWAGVKVARHHTGEFCDPDSIDRNIRADDERAIRDAIQMRVPDLNGRVLSALVCMYENSADRHFVIDRLDEHPNVLFAGGFSGHGFKFASVIGEILADLVTRGEATPDAAFLRARRLVG
jgi:sarcosine oxidase